VTPFAPLDSAVAAGVAAEAADLGRFLGRCASPAIVY
jgi:hypothetical protein